MFPVLRYRYDDGRHYNTNDHFLPPGKPTPIGRIRRSDLRGYELILEGFAQTTVYIVFVCMIYPFGKFVHPDGEDWRIFRFFFRTKDSIYFVCMFLVVDFLQDSVDWALVQRRTNCDFRR